MRDVKRRRMLAILALVGACRGDGDTTWVIGTYSSRHVGARNVSTLLYYEFREDHTLVMSGITDWGRTEIEAEEFTWYPDGDAVAVEFPEPYFGDLGWRVTPGESCNELRIENYREGLSEPNEKIVPRGETCLGELGMCPIGTNCDSNAVIWCDAPPPPCEGETTQ